MGDQEGVRKGIRLDSVSYDSLCLKSYLKLTSETPQLKIINADTLKYSQVDALRYSVPRFLYDPGESERNLLRKGEKKQNAC